MGMNWFDNLKIKHRLLLIISLILISSGIIQMYISLQKEEARLNDMYRLRAQDIATPIMLKVVETMLLRTDETVAVLDNWLHTLSNNTTDAKFWTAWSEPLIKEMSKTDGAVIEHPHDDYDRKAIATGETVTGKQINKETNEEEFRMSIPIILGKGLGDNELCLTCHEAMGLKKGDTIGIISVAISMHKGITEYKELEASIIRDTVLLSVILIAIISFFISSQVVTPIANVTGMLRDLAEKKGSLKKLDYSKNDEIGELVGWFNVFVVRLGELFGIVMKSVDQIASAAEELSSSSAHTSERIVTQSDETGKMASALEEMNASSKEIKNNSEFAHNGANIAQKTAFEGADIVNKAVTSMKQISVSMEETNLQIRNLNKHSEKINEIINVILDIADLTNLLSLNAAIEAARAGEAGRGFAVVASEVRKLAERTTLATRDITRVIETMQNGTNTTTEVIVTMAQKVSEGEDLINQSGVSLNNIVKSINETTSNIGQIANAISEQSNAIDEATRNTESVNTVTKQLVEGAKEVDTFAQFLNRLSNELKREVGTITIEHT